VAKGLGKGLDSLFPTNFPTASVIAGDNDKNSVQEISLDVIVPKDNQPRQKFNEETIEQLSYSIKEHGILQPLVVVKNGNTYTIVAGERRWRAAKRAGLSTAPVIVRTLSELEHLEVALVENIQREDLSPIDQAVSIKRLHDEFNQDYKDIATRLGKAYTTISNLVRLLNLEEKYLRALHDGIISEGHARTLLALEDPHARDQLFLKIVNEAWSVRKAELFVQSFKHSKGDNIKQSVRMKQETPETKQLQKRLGTKVEIRRSAKGGKLSIAFQDDQDLDRIIKLLG